MRILKAAPAPVAAVRDEFDHLVDRILGTTFLGQPGKAYERMWNPSLDFSETGTEYIVRLEAPGIPKDDLEVNLDGQILTVSGRRDFEHEEKAEEFFWREREVGKFVRTVQLPTAVQNGKVAATYKDGIMIIHLPKAEAALKTRIPIG